MPAFCQYRFSLNGKVYSPVSPLHSIAPFTAWNSTGPSIKHQAMWASIDNLSGNLRLGFVEASGLTLVTFGDGGQIPFPALNSPSEIAVDGVRVGPNAMLGAVVWRDNPLSLPPVMKVGAVSLQNLGQSPDQVGAGGIALGAWADPLFRWLPVMLVSLGTGEGNSRHECVVVGGDVAGGLAVAQAFVSPLGLQSGYPFALSAVGSPVSLPTIGAAGTKVSRVFSLTNNRFVVVATQSSAAPGGKVVAESPYVIVGHLDPSTQAITFGSWHQLVIGASAMGVIVNDPTNAAYTDGYASTFGTSGTAGFWWWTCDDTNGPFHGLRFDFPWSTSSDSSVTMPTPTAYAVPADCNSPTWGHGGATFDGAVYLGEPGSFGTVGRPFSLIAMEDNVSGQGGFVAVDFANSDPGFVAPVIDPEGSFGAFGLCNGSNLVDIVPDQTAGIDSNCGWVAANGTPFGIWAVENTSAAFPCCRPIVAPPIRQFPRDDALTGSTARQGIGRARSSSRQHSQRQGFRGVYT